MPTNEDSRNMTDPQINTSSAALIKTASFNNNIELTGGVLAAEALRIVQNWEK